MSDLPLKRCEKTAKCELRVGHDSSTRYTLFVNKGGKNFLAKIIWFVNHSLWTAKNVLHTIYLFILHLKLFQLFWWKFPLCLPKRPLHRWIADETISVKHQQKIDDKLPSIHYLLFAMFHRFHIRLVHETTFSHFAFHHLSLDWAVFWQNVKRIFYVEWEICQNSVNCE